MMSLRKLKRRCCTCASTSAPVRLDRPRQVWPDEASAEAMKKRRQTARKALAELAAVGWTLNEYAKGKWQINRLGGKG